MTSEAMPVICRECPQAGQNIYTKSWYCVNSGAPLGSKRAQDYCTSPKRAGAPAASSPTQPNSPGSAQPPHASASPPPDPEAGTPSEAEAANPAPPKQGGADGAGAPNQAPAGAAGEEELLHGYPFDFL